MAKSTTFKGQAKPFGKSGHYYEPRRHALQAKGFKTGNMAGGTPLLLSKPKGGTPLLLSKPKGREIVEKFKVYKIDDLPKELQDKLMDKYRDINVDYGGWWEQDGLIDLSPEEEEKAGIKGDDYSNKGAGLFSYEFKDVSFDLDRYRYLQIDNLKVNSPTVFRKWLGIPEKLWNKVDYKFDSDGRETNTRLEFYDTESGETYDGSDRITKEEQTILENAQKKFNDKIKEGIKALQENYEYLLSDEAIKETMELNNYEFTASGELYRERK